MSICSSFFFLRERLAVKHVKQVPTYPRHSVPANCIGGLKMKFTGMMFSLPNEGWEGESGDRLGGEQHSMLTARTTQFMPPPPSLNGFTCHDTFMRACARCKDSPADVCCCVSARDR